MMAAEEEVVDEEIVEDEVVEEEVEYEEVEVEQGEDGNVAESSEGADVEEEILENSQAVFDEELFPQDDQSAGDEAPFNSLPAITKWAASLGYKGVQIPTWDGRLFDLEKAATSQAYCDEVAGICADAGVV